MLALIERDAMDSLDHFTHLLDMNFSPMRKLRYHLAGVINMYEQVPYLNRLLGIVIRDSDPKQAKVIADRFIQPVIDAYRRLVDQGVERGEFRPISPMNLYYISIGMCEEIFASRPVLRNCFGIERLDDELKRSFIADVTTFVTAGIAAEKP